ncbi:protein BIC1 [Jatropha curcas]|nr:protein BIC1 [Jatropha curcas]
MYNPMYQEIKKPVNQEPRNQENQESSNQEDQEMNPLSLPLESNQTHYRLTNDYDDDDENQQESEGKTQQSDTGVPVGDQDYGKNEKQETRGKALVQEYDSGCERLRRHRIEVAGRVWIPDIWGQEELLKDWIDCSAFDAPLMPNSIMSARAALVEEGRRATSGRLRIENRC